MATIEYRKVQCDECKKEVTIKENFGPLPDGWLKIDISQWNGNNGEGLFNKEVCSRKCVIKLLNKVKKIPERVHYI